VFSFTKPQEYFKVREITMLFSAQMFVAEKINGNKILAGKPEWKKERLRNIGVEGTILLK
jgi:hypothetical protein